MPDRIEQALDELARYADQAEEDGVDRAPLLGTNPQGVTLSIHGMRLILTALRAAHAFEASWHWDSIQDVRTTVVIHRLEVRSALDTLARAVLGEEVSTDAE